MGSIPTSDMRFEICLKQGSVYVLVLCAGREQWPSRTPALVGGQSVMIYGAFPLRPLHPGFPFRPRRPMPLYMYSLLAGRSSLSSILLKDSK